MHRKISAPWAQSDIQKLTEYTRSGASPFRTAAALHRTVASVRSMAQRLGLRFETNQQRRMNGGLAPGKNAPHLEGYR
jgi:hypothetical protein